MALEPVLDGESVPSLSLPGLEPFFVVVIAGWVAALVSLGLGLRLGKLGWLVIALVVFAAALTGLAWREHRRLVADRTNAMETRNADRFATYLRKAIGNRYEEDLEPLPDGVGIEIYASGLGIATGFAWIPGTEHTLVTERTGAIRVLHGKELAPEECTTVPASTSGENDGLLGIELSPAFQRDHWVYIYYTDSERRDNRGPSFHRYRGLSLRLTEGHLVWDPYVQRCD